LLVFRLDDRRYGLPLEAVDRAVRAVDVTPLPGAPGLVLGAISVSGQIVPVLNVRRRFQVPERAIRLTDWFLLAHTARRAVALVVDGSEGVLQRDPREVTPSSETGTGKTAFPGVTPYDDGLMFIHDLDLFLGLDDERTLDAALSRTHHGAPAADATAGTDSRA
jgi:purine-binding chemotaxis protein CheW